MRSSRTCPYREAKEPPAAIYQAIAKEVGCEKAVSDCKLDSDRATQLLIELIRDACATASAQYDDYYKSFVGLDSKAIAAGTIGGILFGAIVAFLNKPKLLSVVVTGAAWHELLLFCAPLGSVLTIILSVFVVQVRNAALATSAEIQIAEISDLCAIDRSHLSSSHIVDFYMTSLSNFEESLCDLASHVQSKGTILRWTHWSLLFTVASTLALVWILILGAHAF